MWAKLCTGGAKLYSFTQGSQPSDQPTQCWRKAIAVSRRVKQQSRNQRRAAQPIDWSWIVDSLPNAAKRHHMRISQRVEERQIYCRQRKLFEVVCHPWIFTKCRAARSNCWNSDWTCLSENFLSPGFFYVFLFAVFGLCVKNLSLE